MNKHLKHTGIWIDQNKAVVVTSDLIGSIIIPIFTSSDKPQNRINGSEFQRRQPGNFFTRISEMVPATDALLIIGPDQTKFFFKDFIATNRTDLKVLQTKVAGHLGTPDLVSTIRNYFYPAMQVNQESGKDESGQTRSPSTRQRDTGHLIA